METTKRASYRMKFIWGISLMTLLAISGILLAFLFPSLHRTAFKTILLLMLILTALDLAWIISCYFSWRKEADKVIAVFSDLYGMLLQPTCMIQSDLDVLGQIKLASKQLEAALNEALVSSLALKQAEINALQSQINPHFLYNILDSIRGQALSEGVTEIADMIESLADYFRYCISKEDDVVTLADELRNVQNYWIIQKYRFGNKISMQVILDHEEICPDEYEIPKLILQPIVENAIFHGLETKLGEGTVTIRITCTDSRLIIIVVDDGIGMGPQELAYLRRQLKENQRVISKKETVPPRRSGIALANVNERIKLHYGDEYGLQISSTPKTGTEVEFVLPVCSAHNHKEHI